MFAGASWAILAARPLVNRASFSLLTYSSAAIIVAGQALTAGRAGYAAWAHWD